MKGSAWKKVSFEDLNISFERENSSDGLLTNKSKENKRQSKQTKTKNTSPFFETKEAAKKKSFTSQPPQLVFTDFSEPHTNGGKTKDSGKEKFGTANGTDKTKSLVSRLRANTWSPKQENTEFDSIGLLHKQSEQLEEAKCSLEAKFDEGRLTSLQELSYTESLYLASPKISSSSFRQRFRDKNSRFDKNNGYESLNLKPVGVGDTSPRSYNRNLKFGNDIPRLIDTNTAYEDRCPEFQDTKPDPTFEDPTFLDPRFMDPRFENTKRDSHINLKNVTSGRSLLAPQNNCDKKNCSTLSPTCTHRLRALSNESLPRVPLGKVNLVQAGVWQRLTDDDSPASRNRSFTH